MNINIDKLLVKQRTRLENINNTAPEYEENYGNVNELVIDYGKTELAVSHTNMMVLIVEGVKTLTLTRVIASFVYRVEFNYAARCCDVVKWFEVTDKIFMQCSKRTKG